MGGGLEARVVAGGAYGFSSGMGSIPNGIRYRLEDKESIPGETGGLPFSRAKKASATG